MSTAQVTEDLQRETTRYWSVFMWRQGYALFLLTSGSYRRPVLCFSSLNSFKWNKRVHIVTIIRSVIVDGVRIDNRIYCTLVPKLVSNYSAKLYLLTYGAETFLRRCQLCSQSRNSQNFKEPKGSLPCSQEPSTSPYPKPDQSSPYHTILSL
jgi:hypothetical protein